MIMLAVLLTMLIVSLVYEGENAEITEGAIVSNNSTDPYQTSID